MDKFLIAVGCQESKLDFLDRKQKRKLMDFLQVQGTQYKSVISVIRCAMQGSDNFKRSNDTLGNTSVEYLSYPSDTVLEVPGYDLDCKGFRKDVIYDIVGMSSAASVLTIAMSMYSNGYKVRVLEEYCFDRKGDDMHEAAFDIMEAYMPGCVVKEG